MKLRSSRAVLSAGLILGTAFGLAGCATSGNQRSADTRTTMGEVENDYKQALAQVDATSGSLEILLKQEDGPKKRSFEKFSDNVKRMKGMQGRLFDHADKMQSQQKNYFEEWRKQGNTYNDPRIQALSEQRRADLTLVFSHIAESSVGVKGAIKAYLSDIQQIQVYLSTDLTPKGIDSIEPVARNAIEDGDELRKAIDPVLSSIHDAKIELGEGAKDSKVPHRSSTFYLAKLAPQTQP